MTYNYSGLSPIDFEHLIRDLLQAEMEARLETFPPGADGGVDVRLMEDGEEKLIVQCKHSPGKNYGAIKSGLKKEAAKSAHFHGKRYILATTAKLTRANKEEIRQLFSGIIRCQSDIWGVDDVDNLLKRHPDVERVHFKLWISTFAAMQRVVNHDIYIRSDDLNEAIKKARTYVPGEATKHAMEMLNKYQACLISGEPGVGKTTLAEILALQHFESGWQAYQASEDISEIEKIWNPNERQIFIYDDFLGQNSLDRKLNKNEDSRICKIISRVQGSPNKRLILTTREYILQQANQTYEPLRRSSDVERVKFTLHIGQHTKLQREQIIYNHLYFSNLKDSVRDSAINEGRYKDLALHANYNPRLISLAISTWEDDKSERGLSQYLRDSLDDPGGLWSSIFEDQLSEVERNILICLSLFTHYVSVNDLRRAVTRYSECADSLHPTSKEFNRALRRLQGTFLRVDEFPLAGSSPNLSERVQLIRLANPSFHDYIRHYFISNGNAVDDLVSGSSFFEQLRTIWRWHAGGIQAAPMPFSNIWRFQMHIDLPGTRLLNGRTQTFRQSLLRLLDTPSCYWSIVNGPTQSANGLLHSARRPGKSQARRDADALYMVGQLHGLTPEELADFYRRSVRRISDDSLQLDTERETRVIYLMRISEGNSLDVEKLRQNLFRRVVKNLDSLDQFILAYDLTDGVDSSGTSDEVTFLSERFVEISADLDNRAACASASLEECEENLAFLREFATNIGVTDKLRTPKLDAAIEMWSSEKRKNF